MRSLRFVVIVVSIVAGIGIGFGLGLHVEAEPERTAAGATHPGSYAQLDSRILRLEEAIESIRQAQERQTLRPVEDRLTAAKGQSDRASRPDVDPRPGREEEDERLEAAEAEVRAEEALAEDTFYVLEEALREEPFDGAWANEQEAFMTERFGRDEAGSTRLVDVRCQSTLCRVELEHETEEDQLLFPMMGLADPRFTGREILSRHVESPQGELRTELFLSRKDHALPSTTGDRDG